MCDMKKQISCYYWQDRVSQWYSQTWWHNRLIRMALLEACRLIIKQYPVYLHWKMWKVLSIFLVCSANRFRLYEHQWENHTATSNYSTIEYLNYLLIGSLRFVCVIHGRNSISDQLIWQCYANQFCTQLKRVIFL